LHQHPAAHREPDVESTHIEEPSDVPELDGLVNQGLIRGVYARLTSGKEATVYCCRAHSSTRRKFLAAKVYREHAARSIRRGLYFEGRERGMKARELRAIRTGTDFGHRVMAGVWMAQEYACLKRLSEIGANVPKPWAICGRVLLMDYVGNGAGPAPHLDGIDMSPETARRYFEDISADVETMLTEHLVHGDLSSYNILVWDDRPWIIDMPQAVDVRFNRNAFELLERDLRNVYGFFKRYGIADRAAEHAIQLWERYQRANL
jgi:RIO kinase 1